MQFTLLFHCAADAFSEDGTVTSVRLLTDGQTGRPKGYGYVEFADLEGLKNALLRDGYVASRFANALTHHALHERNENANLIDCIF